MKLLMFGAVWCPGCIVTEAKVKQIKQEFENLETIYYDSEENDVEFENFKIGDIIPVLVLVDEFGKELDRLVGEKTKKDIKKMISNYLS